MTYEEKKQAIELVGKAVQDVLEQQKKLIEQLNTTSNIMREKIWREISKLDGKYEVYYYIYEKLNKELF